MKCLLVEFAKAAITPPKSPNYTIIILENIYFTSSYENMIYSV